MTGNRSKAEAPQSEERENMRSLFPNTYDRADLVMSAGCSTFVSAALILVMPRLGIVALEILLGLFLIGCALVARARLRRRGSIQTGGARGGSSAARRKWLDRYDALMIAAVIVIQISAGGVLRRAGWPEGGIRMFPLILLGTAILLKPPLTQAFDRLRKREARSKNSDPSSIANLRNDITAAAPECKSSVYAEKVDE